MSKPANIRNGIPLYTLLLLVGYLATLATADYNVGIGIADATGPIAEVTFMGYAKAAQKGRGLHLRQYARAFIIQDESTRVCFVSVDYAMVGHGVRKEILQELHNKLGNVYNEQNFVLSATHTHSGPGGYMQDLLFDISSFGFVKESFAAFTSGVVKAVLRAHKSMQRARIYLNSGEVSDANINRSPAAYLLNPQSEKERYKYNVDKEMTQLKFVASSTKKVLGVIQWFAVHPTSMNNSNVLVSSDNVGYASILLEQHFNKKRLIGKGPFVAAFASTNLGDVSPNIKGPHCINTGNPCDDVSSTCDGVAKYCVAFGPGKDMFDSTKIIAQRLYRKALELMKGEDAREVVGPLKVGHRFVDMPNQTAEYTFPNGTITKVHGCVPAMGYSFAAGTTDGPGEFDFKQGTVTDNALWNLVRDFLAPPTKEDIECHHPKPILLATGRMIFPYQWQPSIVSIQALIIGDVVIAPVPGEFTTMSGRRMTEKLAKVMRENGFNNPKVVVAGLSNVYSDYVATPEEYQLQRYEAASTIYGPHTLTLYLDLYAHLVDALMKGKPVDATLQPPDLPKNLLSLISPVIFDNPGWKVEFGDCTKQPPSVARAGDIVTVEFVAGNPRNNVMHEKTFLSVERQVNEDDWVVVATDANWETKFKWERTSVLFGTSKVIIEWAITEDVEPGVYRIRHFGHYKYILGGIFPYEGLTNNFAIM